MASLGHIAVGMATARAYRDRGSRRPIAWAMLWWSFLAFLPDIDVVGFAFGIRYGEPWGHRGATHSLAFAVLLGAVIGAMAPAFGRPRIRTGVVAIAIIVSHGLLDTLTTGGLGCALLWPFDTTRYLAPWGIIPAAPIGFAFWTARGFSVAAIELALFFPLLAYALWPRRRRVEAGL